MTTLIVKFAHEAGIKSTWEQAVSPAELKFAELIIAQCCAIVALDSDRPAQQVVREIKNCFEVCG